tara:strand:+ start:14345 stop:16387 length:2043 start_codon:yes stop_codon:yes gene_type:complete
MTLKKFRDRYPEYNDLSDQELADKLYNSSYSDMPRSEFNKKMKINSNVPTPPQPDQGFINNVVNTFKEIGEDLTYDNVVKYLVENQGLPIGIAGSIAGVIIGGTVAGPVGAVGGGVIGGALGTGVGSATSDITAGRDIDEVRVLTEAGMSLGIDIVTLGLGKFVGKPILSLIKKARSKGTPATDIVQKIARGEITPESTVLREVGESQELAETVGASLVPSQLEGAVVPKFQITKELLGRTGILSKNVFEDNQQKIVDLVRQRQAELLSGTKAGLTDDVVGKGLMDAFNEANKVNIKNYGTALEEIRNQASKFTVSADGIRSSLSRYLNKKELKDEFGKSLLDKDTQAVVKELKDGIPENVKTVSGSYLITFEKRLTDAINKAGNLNSPSFNPNAKRELTNMRRHFQARTRMKLSKENPVLRKQYVKLQKSYGEFQSAVFPEINKSFVRNAGRESYASLGAMLTQPNKVESVKAVMKSIDKAYSTVGSEASKLPFKSAAEAKNVIKRHYVEKVLPNSDMPGFDLKSFSRLSKNLKSDANLRETVKTVLGKDYGSFRKTVNLMALAAKKPEGGLATLFLRSREYAAGAAGAAAVYTGGIGAIPAIATVGAVFFGPVMLSKIATNPKHIRKLLEIDQVGGKNPERAMAIANVIINDVTDDLLAQGESEDNVFRMLKTRPGNN